MTDLNDSQVSLTEILEAEGWDDEDGMWDEDPAAQGDYCALVISSKVVSDSKASA